MKRNEHTTELNLAAEQMDKERDYWQAKLAGELEKCSFPYDRHETGENKIEMQRITFKWTGEYYERMMKIIKRSDVRLYILLVTGLNILINKYTAVKDIIVGTPTYKQEVEGDLINTVLALRNNRDEGMTVREYLMQVGNTIFEANENQNYPMETLLYKLGMPYDKQNFPLFDIAVLLDNLHDREYIRHIHTDTVITLSRTDGALEGEWEYNARHYRRATVERIVGHYRRALEEVMEKINDPLTEIDILTEEEKKRLIEEFNDNRAEYSRDKTVSRQFEEQAEKNPDRTALDYKDVRLTIGELNKRANRLARQLRAKGVGEDQTVGIMQERTPEMFVAIQAVWKAGGAYIPIDPAYPAARTLGILNDSGSRVLITTTESRKKENSRIEKEYDGTIITPEEYDGEIGNDDNLNIDIDMSSLAYVIYTSGSTGKPKGVMVEHSGMMNHLGAKINDLGITGESIVVQNASHTFDISVWQYMVAQVVGGRTVIIPEEQVLEPEIFIQQVIKDRVTVLEVVPSYLSLLMETIEAGSPPPLPLEYLMVTGEEVKPHQVRQWFDRYPGIKMVNAYGPTEASDDITHYIMDAATVPAAATRIPIGKAVQNLNIYIVDENMKLCPIGVKGEIVVSGVGVGRGYQNDMEKTRQAFMEDPFIGRKAVRLYKTGDQGYIRPDGNIEFQGRKDNQVKIRGFRIELGEIENLLQRRPEVKEAVVRVCDEGGGAGQTLCAYLVPRKESRKEGQAGNEAGNEPLAISDIKAYLHRQLPGYIVPAHFVELERMPLTPNGKIDRKALPEPETTGGGYLQYVTAGEIDRLGDIEKRIEMLDDLSRISGDESRAVEAIAKQREQSVYPLNYAQKMIYYIEKTYPGTSCETYGHIVLYDEGDRDYRREKEHLEKALNHALRQVENLRTRIAEVEYEDYVGPVQYFAPAAEETFDEKEFPGEDGEEKLKKWVQQHVDQPFRFIGGPLYYVAAVKLDGQYGYYIKAHHIVFDGSSIYYYIDDVDKIYRQLRAGNEIGQQANQTPLQFAVEEREYFNTGKWKEDRRYWVDYLQPLPQETGIGKRITGTAQLKGKVYRVKVDDRLRAKMHDYRKENRTSLYKLVLSAYAVYLQQRTGRREFIVGTINHSRHKESLKRMKGMFINLLPLKINADPNETFRELVEKNNRQINHILKNHSRYPGSALSNDLMKLTGRDTRYFWDITLIGHPDLKKENYRMELIPSTLETTPITLHINRDNKDIYGILELEWLYLEARVTEAEIAEMHESLIAILEQALDEPGRRIAEIGRKDAGSLEAGAEERKGTNETAEMEAQLKQHPEIDEAAVIAGEDETGENPTRGYVVAGRKLREAEIKEYFAERRPQHKVPAALIQLEKMPRTEDGEIDRAVLETVKPERKTAHRAPANEREKKIIEIIAAELGIDKEAMDADSNIFDHGGHSLIVIRISSKLHKELDVKVPIKEIFENPTAAGIARYMQSVAEDRYAAIEPVEEEEYYTLSSAQKRLYIVQQMSKESTAYNISRVYRLEGELDRRRIESTFEKLIERHESLRTSLVMVEEEPVQQVHRRVDFRVEYNDRGNDEEGKSGVDDVIKSFQRPFDLARAPLMRVGLIKTGEKEHILMLDMHHIISDGISMGIFVLESMALYEGETLQPLRLQYKDYTRWENDYLKSEALRRQEEYWLSQFEGEQPQLNLPLDRERTAEQDNEGIVVTGRVEPGQTAKLMEIAASRGATLNMMVMAIFNVMLAKYTEQQDIVIGVPVNGRLHPDLEHIVGMFINMLALRNKPAYKKRYIDFLEEVRETTVKAYDNQAYQFDQLVEKLRLERNLNRNPLVDVVYNYFASDAPAKRQELPEVEIKDLSIKPYEREGEVQQSKFDMLLNAVEANDGIYYHFRCAARLFDRGTVEKFDRSFRRIIEQVISDPEMEIYKIEIIGEEELEQLEGTTGDHGTELEVKFNF